MADSWCGIAQRDPFPAPPFKLLSANCPRTTCQKYSGVALRRTGHYSCELVQSTIRASFSLPSVEPKALQANNSSNRPYLRTTGFHFMITFHNPAASLSHTEEPMNAVAYSLHYIGCSATPHRPHNCQ